VRPEHTSPWRRSSAVHPARICLVLHLGLAMHVVFTYLCPCLVVLLWLSCMPQHCITCWT
jgi:hypothetical protein